MRNRKSNIYYESFINLKTRFKKNNISKELIKNKRVLDFGAYNGNYSMSLYKMGAKKVEAFDFKKKPDNFPKKINYYNSINQLITSEVLDLILDNKKNFFPFCYSSKYLGPSILETV